MNCRVKVVNVKKREGCIKKSCLYKQLLHTRMATHIHMNLKKEKTMQFFFQCMDINVNIL